MTFPDAYRALEAKYPTGSFCIGLDVWRHKHLIGSDTDQQNPRIEWAIWLAEGSKWWVAQTLELAVAQAVTEPDTLMEAERTIKHFPDGSGYEIMGKLGG